MFISLILAACLIQPPANAGFAGNAIAAITSTASPRLEVPAPLLREAVNGVLDLKDLAGADAHVDFTYPAIANGDTAGMRWTGKTVYNAKVQTVGATRPLVFVIPNATVLQSRDASAVLTGSVGVGDNRLVISTPLTVSIVDTTPPPDPGDLPAPAVPEAVNREVDVGRLGANVVVNVAYPSLANGHKVSVRWTGISPFSTAIQTATSATPLKFNVPRATMLKDFNNTALVTYSTQVPGAALKESEPQSIKVILGNFPAPSLPEAPDGELHIDKMGANAVFKVTYPSFGAGHKVTLRWAGATTFTTPVQTTTTASPLTFNVPKATVAKDFNGAAIATYTVQVPGVAAQTSEPLPVKVIFGELPAPNLPDAAAGSLDISKLGASTVANVIYPSLAAGHKVALHWKGVTTYDSPAQTAGTTNPLEFNLPRITAAKDLNKAAELTYTLDIPGVPTQTSQPLKVQVTSSDMSLPAPALTNLQGGVIDIGRYPGNLTATVTYPDIHPGQKVFVRWKGMSEYSAPIQTASTGNSLTFLIPAPALKGDLAGSGTLEYVVDIDGAVQRVSELLRVAVTSTISAGQQVANELNARYADTANVCKDSKPAYYCNGVIIRSTENGNYDPWNPSPAAQRLGGVSFSYMRKDSYVNDLYHRSGFTFLPQEVAVSRGKQVDYLCIYAYDAGTLVGVRGAQGCGLKPRSAPLRDISTCGSLGVRTVAQWYAYTRTLANRDYQCSLSTADATQFATSFQVRANRPSNMEALWNEMMAKLWPQNIPSSLPLESFFYKSAAALPEAKIYQTKYAARTAGGWLPIIKLDLTKLNGSPFSYNAGDQAIQP
jgi:hypothetical protein